METPQRKLNHPTVKKTEKKDKKIEGKDKKTEGKEEENEEKVVKKIEKKDKIIEGKDKKTEENEEKKDKIIEGKTEKKDKKVEKIMMMVKIPKKIIVKNHLLKKEKDKDKISLKLIKEAICTTLSPKKPQEDILSLKLKLQKIPDLISIALFN